MSWNSFVAEFTSPEVPGGWFKVILTGSKTDLKTGYTSILKCLHSLQIRI